MKILKIEYCKNYNFECPYYGHEIKSLNSYRVCRHGCGYYTANNITPEPTDKQFDNYNIREILIERGENLAISNIIPIPDWCELEDVDENL